MKYTMKDIMGSTTVMPTEEQLAVLSAKWWKEQENTSFLAYNAYLKDTTFAFEICSLSKEWMKKMLELPEQHTPDDIKWCCDELETIITPALKKLSCEGSFFCKLISRSPKDYLTDHITPIALTSVKDCFEALSGSMRTFEDMVWLYSIPKKAYLVIRPFIKIDPRWEFRTYIKNREVVGISQYYYNNDFTAEECNPAGYADQMRFMIPGFLKAHVLDHIKDDNFIADTVLLENEHGGGCMYLVETNPWGISDPCLFKAYNQFNSTIRYLQNGKMEEMPLL